MIDIYDAEGEAVQKTRIGVIIGGSWTRSWLGCTVGTKEAWTGRSRGSAATVPEAVLKSAERGTEFPEIYGVQRKSEVVLRLLRAKRSMRSLRARCGPMRSTWSASSSKQGDAAGPQTRSRTNATMLAPREDRELMTAALELGRALHRKGGSTTSGKKQRR